MQPRVHSYKNTLLHVDAVEKQEAKRVNVSVTGAQELSSSKPKVKTHITSIFEIDKDTSLIATYTVKWYKIIKVMFIAINCVPLQHLHNSNKTFQKCKTLNISNVFRKKGLLTEKIVK